ncbi:BRO family protein [Corynebacterium sp. AOP40-9SA-29]|uniref:BRO family protein n=1 Tax=Corynebacterium sp. AOP40-9SA-29 TaxID=3457677 RepID=UPI0040336163
MSPFDGIRQVDEDGAEFWSARDLMPLLGYSAWRNLAVPMNRAMATAVNQGHDKARHFAGSRKVSVSGPPQEDVLLTRFAAYLVAMNGDPNKAEVAAAQSYFAVNTYENEQRKAEPQFEIPATYAAALRAAADATDRAEIAERQVGAGPRTWALPRWR